MNYETKDKIVTILAVSGIILCVVSLLVWGSWTSDNGVRVTTGKAYNRDMTKAQQKELVYPIEVTSRIKYRGNYINSESRVVEFCDVKATKKEMEGEMKIIWKEMRKGCK